ncbi:MAG: hypothetical protein R3Y59_07780 [bacterium]
MYKNIGLEDLTSKEMKMINGGDKFLKDLGNGLGQICGYIVNAAEVVGDAIVEGCVSLGETVPGYKR